MSDRGWSYENDEETLDQWLILDAKTRELVATVPKTGDERRDDRVAFRNAVLLAAAPTMLAALRSIVEWTGEPDARLPIERREMMVRNAALAAIARATRGLT